MENYRWVSAMNCPLCGSRSDILKNFHCGNFDKSFLYSDVTICCCTFCGHTYNQLTKKDVENLSKYYLGEYLDCHSSINEVKGKASNTFEVTQYDLPHYLKVLTTLNDTNILVGIDYSKKYDLIFLDHFLEHVYNPKNLFNLLRECLASDGIIKISIPDALNYYGEALHFPNYNFIMREHIQHFDSIHLLYLVNSCGFTVIKEKSVMKQIISGVFMPSIEVTLKLSKKYLKLVPSNRFFDFKKKVATVVFDTPVVHSGYYYYGIGREFFYLLGEGFIKNPLGLIDNTPVKATYTVNGMNINSDSLLPTLNEDDSKNELLQHQIA